MTEAYEFVSQSETDTRRLGLVIGQHLEAATVIGLTGTLGTGKTRLTQSIAEGLGLDPRNVVSPTYTICVPYSARINVLHLDAYRIKEDEEVDEFGLDERVEEGEALIIEWVERIVHLTPPVDLQIGVQQTGETSREFACTGLTDKGRRLLGRLQAALQTEDSGSSSK